MVKRYSASTKLSHAKAIAKQGGCFIVEKGGCDDKVYILYRENLPRNVTVGRRKSVEGILMLAKKATTAIKA
jgi:hypothetical protein